MKCIYHSRDLDGYCSGAIVKLRYPDAELIGYDYGQPIDFLDTVRAGELVVMIDVSLPMDYMFMLAKKCRGNFIWVDHHISAINEYKDYLEKNIDADYKPYAVLIHSIAACEIGWNYFFPSNPMPLAVRLLGEYDTWRNELESHWLGAALPFQYGMRMHCSSPESFPQNLFKLDSGSLVNAIIDQGSTIIKYQKQQNERACRSAFEIEFEGLRAICLNNGGANSMVFDSVYDESKHDIMIPFFYTGKYWTFSIYTTKPDIDCSVIAKKHGGGGHKKAAGFQKDELPEIFKAK